MKGAVLAGGKSIRFGEDKSLVEFDGVTFVERAVRFLEVLELNPIIVRNSFQDFSFLECPTVEDLIPEKGPLGGLYTALSYFSGEPVMIVTCDMPKLRLSRLKELQDNFDEDKLVTLFEITKDRYQPFPGIYKPELASEALAKLNNNELSLQGFLKNISEKKLIQCDEVEEFLNVNEQKDMKEIN